MKHKLFILLFFYLCFDSIYTLTSTEPIVINFEEKKDIVVSGTEVYIATQNKEDGLINYILSLSTSHSSLKDKIYYTTSDSLSFEGKPFKKIDNVSEYNGNSKQYYFSIRVKENHYAISKITDLVEDETITLECYYVSLGFTVGIIIGLIIVAIIILCLICCVIKKCLC